MPGPSEYSDSDSSGSPPPREPLALLDLLPPELGARVLTEAGWSAVVRTAFSSKKAWEFVQEHLGYKGLYALASEYEGQLARSGYVTSSFEFRSIGPDEEVLVASHLLPVVDRIMQTMF